jgi:hypothetical protein
LAMGVCFDVSLKRLVSVFVFTLYCVHFNDCPHELVCWGGAPPPKKKKKKKKTKMGG